MTYEDARLELIATLVDAGLADAKVLMPLNPVFEPTFMVEMAVADGRKVCMAVESDGVGKTSRAEFASQLRGAYERFLDRSAT